MNTQNFEHVDPKLDLFQYFDGQTDAWGIFEDRFGNVRRQFEVSIEGTIEDQQLTLDEQFTYKDGEKDQRIWRITRTGEGSYIGEADDVVGQAKGTSVGNSLTWTYDLNLKVGDSSYKVHFDDLMLLQTDKVMINRAQVSKWGIDIGEVTLFFIKP